MPVMRHLNVGGTTYDTVGEASVTRVLNSGTKIATVSIDGTSTDLYAPSGGSSVEPATAAPIADGTAAVGSSAKYAREDHVHPTDTSRAAASHTHAIADVTSLQSTLDGKAASSHTHAASDVASGTLDIARIPTGTSGTTVALGNHTHSGYAPTSHEHSGADITSGTVGFSYLPTGTGASQVAVGNHTHSGYASSTHYHGSITSVGAITSDTAVESGDKLVIVDANDANKLKRSSIALGTSTSTFLRNDGTWAAPSGGGGGSWTEITNDIMTEEYGAFAFFSAFTDGKTVIVTGQIGAESTAAEISSDYEAFPTIFVASCTNSGGSVSYPPYVDGHGSGVTALYSGDGTLGEFFTVMYPLAPAAS